MTMIEFILNNIRIRRIEFFPSEIPIVSIPFLLTMSHYSEFNNLYVLEGILLFFLSFNFGDMINCLADRDLDATYKSRLSKAVYAIGPRFVAWQIIITAILTLIIAFHLSWVLDQWWILGLQIIGLFFAAQYSIPPLHLKSGGIWQVPCLMSILFFIPMSYLALIITPALSSSLVIFLLGYSAMQTGLVLLNSAEDYTEDLEMNLNTSIIALGIPKSMLLANIVFFVGTGTVAGTLAVWFYQNDLTLWRYISLAVFSTAWLLIQYHFWQVYKATINANLEDTMLAVRKKAKFVPLWLTFMGWACLVCALMLLLHKSS